MGQVTEPKTTCSRVAGTSSDNGGTDVAGVDRRELAMTPAAATELVTRQVLVTITGPNRKYSNVSL